MITQMHHANYPIDELCAAFGLSRSGDCAHLRKPEGRRLCGQPPHEAMEAVLRLSSHLAPRGLVVFTLKFSRTETTRDPLQLLRNITTQAHSHGLTLLARTHLTYNGHEFTLFFERGDFKGK